jgi:hypothetical protein
VKRRILLVTAAWLLGAALTATAATAAVNALGSGLLGQGSPVLSEDEVQRRLASAAPESTPPPATGTPIPGTPAPSTSPAGTRVLATAGGTVVARCAAGQATLLSWSPAQGYRTDEVNRGPAAAASVRFKADRTELTVTVTCAGDEPQATTATDNRHGG